MIINANKNESSASHKQQPTSPAEKSNRAQLHSVMFCLQQRIVAVNETKGKLKTLIHNKKAANIMQRKTLKEFLQEVRNIRLAKI